MLSSECALSTETIAAEDAGASMLAKLLARRSRLPTKCNICSTVVQQLHKLAQYDAALYRLIPTH